jgi:4-amino-4-deoxy-L-arabinose transferase-like glycosyltransferase
MQSGLDWGKILPLLIPILIIQIGLQIYALIDLYRQPSVRGSKILWAVVIILGEIIGPIVYFIFAKRDET